MPSHCLLMVHPSLADNLPVSTANRIRCTLSLVRSCIPIDGAASCRIVHALLHPSNHVQRNALQLNWAVPVGDAASTAHEQERGSHAAGGACHAIGLLLIQAL